MQKSLLAGALCALTFGFVGANARAQTAPIADVQIAPTGGYNLLLEARKLLLPGPNGEPSSPDELAPDENLRRQRLAVARNAPALAKLREALKLGIAIPTEFAAEEAGKTLMANNAAAREFARQLSQEAAVRAADGDALGAAQSSLDALRLGAQISRGPLINNLVGIAISSIARKSLEQHAAQLDAAQLREVAAQWQTISARMPTFAQTLREEEKVQAREGDRMFAQVFANAANPAKRAEFEAAIADEVAKGETTEEEANVVRADIEKYANSTYADAEADRRSAFEQLRTRAEMPYFAAVQAAPIELKFESMLRVGLDVITTPQARFLGERSIASNRLLVDALRLRAVKLETGAYPATFEASVDPFSPTLSPLIYKREGDSYLLYSVGPDGQDENGGEIITLMTDDETGAQTVTDRLTAESFGDIVAPVL